MPFTHIVIYSMTHPFFHLWCKVFQLAIKYFIVCHHDLKLAWFRVRDYRQHVKGLPLHMILRFTSILLLITLAAEHAAVLALPFSHKSYMTNKTVAGTTATVWVLSAVLTAIITIVVPANIVWLLAVINFSDDIIPFIMSARLIVAAFILVTNAYLFYKAAASKRKARKNKTQGNQGKAVRYAKLVQLLRSHLKPTITVLVVGGIDVIANTVLCIGYVKLYHSAEDTNNI